MTTSFLRALALLLLSSVSATSAEPGKQFVITQNGAVADGVTLNTVAIQKTIEAAAAAGGGTVVIPRGTFVSGAIFLKPGVHLHLDADAVLRCSNDMANFPSQRTRIEGHFEDSFNPALINADGCDGLRITGEGVLDGAGRPVWDLFWKLREAAPDRNAFKNLSVARARLTLIQSSRGVVVEGVTFKDSQFWNLHLYKCRDVLVQNARFLVPDDYQQAPSSDGIDVDSCQDVAIKSCHFSVTDDCIALKGSKGPLALEDKDSPPVERVRISDCVFKRGHAAVTLGSEATVVKDIVVENCKVVGAMAVINFKLRSDTPQHYEDIHYRNIALEGTGGSLLSIQPWKQYADLGGQPPPKSVVRNLTITDIAGSYGSFGVVQGNSGQTAISAITLKKDRSEAKEREAQGRRRQQSPIRERLDQRPQGNCSRRTMKNHSSMPILIAALAMATMLSDVAAQNPLAWPPVTKENMPGTRWWWMGSAVNPADLARELKRYREAGLGTVAITPIYGVKSYESQFIEYLSPQWMEMLQATVTETQMLDMNVDMVTGTGWCFGGPQLSDQDANALAVYKGGSVSQKPSGQKVKRPAPGGEGWMLNLLYPDAMTRYLQRFSDALANYDGPKPHAQFHDSYEYRSDWAPDFFEQFERRRGYNLHGELPALFEGQGDPEHVARVKGDYRETAIRRTCTFPSSATTSSPSWRVRRGISNSSFTRWVRRRWANSGLRVGPCTWRASSSSAPCGAGFSMNGKAPARRRTA
ncbi:MAG TPA: glycosyl hydrolase family 28 protein [Chthoniobacteraceae bacterium]|jgi:alpha-L-rhamnosidase|nr:glycosyl hydrolase family 28 protein [Chthoniobacteraceae bacterium]